jgi:Tol biopolymer transport system component/predicted Ser/Thr protein kinase
MVGQTVSHYKILEKLGEGGMGVVYKAEDLKLTRTVALKFLPHGLDAHEPERARFLQEARAAAILNHPNICTVYDIQEFEEQQFIVMEYVEGKTLREIVPVKKMQDAITYAVQIAEALQEAHTHGIVHRDIKAENIMVNTKNQVKVMDFGLAKLKGSLKLTKTSSTVGTLAYMAPEQIQGEGVDARSDIFSFGIVLYDMLAGHLPFRGEHEAAMMYSIVNENPEPLQHYVPEAPSELLHIIDRALEKDREDRYQTVHEMLIDLRRLKKETARVVRQPRQVWPGTVIAAQERVAVGKRTWKRLLWVGAAIIVLLCITSMVVLMLTRSRVRLNPNRTTVTLKIPLKEMTMLSLSQDGNWVAVASVDERGREDVYWMNVGGEKPSRLTEESAYNIGGVDLSPDASQVAYGCLDQPDGVYRVKLSLTQGGGSRTLADTGIGPVWRRDGQRIGYIRMGMSGNFPSVSGKLEIWSVKPDGSDRRRELIDSIAARHSPWGFCWSPDGTSIVWLRNYPPDYAELMVCELSSGKKRQLTFDRKYVNDVTWATNGQILFPSNRSGALNIWMMPSSGGEATQITYGGAPMREMKISRDNSTLALKQIERVTHIWLSALDGRNAREINSDDVWVMDARLSPDGRRIAHVSGDADRSNPVAHLHIADRDGNNRRQLTSGSEIVTLCGWSADGKYLAYASRALGEPVDSTRVFLIRPDNPGSPRLLCSGSLFVWVDGRRIAVYREGKTLLHTITGETPVQCFEDSTFARPIRGDTEILYLDYRRGKEGWWVVSVDARNVLRGKAHKLLSPRTELALHPEGRFFISMKENNQIWRISIPGGKEERIGTAAPRLSVGDISRDGGEILWYKDLTPSKIVLVKDVFE